MQQEIIAAANEMTVDDLEVLYEDTELLVVHKPAGMLTHRGWGNDKVTAVQLVKEYTDADTAYPIHRLDRATSGPVLFAKDAHIARLLNELFDERTVDKRYFAVTRGITPEEGVIDHAIPRKPKGPRVPAVTEFRRLGVVLDRYALVEARPQTGRLHQVRRHFKHISCHLIGDTNYGKGKHNRLWRQRFNLKRLMLHCWHLGFTHPVRETAIRIVAPVPENLREPLERSGYEPRMWEDVTSSLEPTPSPSAISARDDQKIADDA